MSDVFDYAKYFIKNGNNFAKNTFDGNMKLQKLLTFANFINFVENGEALFDEEMLAFRNGCVVDRVRLRYKYNYDSFISDSERFEAEFNETEYRVLNMVLRIFGDASAKELSEINHQFDFWKIAYKRGTDENGYHDKELEVVDMNVSSSDIDKMKMIINAYEESEQNVEASETINGVVFYYDGFELTDDIIDQLEQFSFTADDDSYSVCMDDGELVIY